MSNEIKHLDLLPCPFCNAICEYEIEGDMEDGYAVDITADHLKWCPFTGSRQTGMDNGMSFDFKSDAELESFVNNWNRRAQPFRSIRVNVGDQHAEIEISRDIPNLEIFAKNNLEMMLTAVLRHYKPTIPTLDAKWAFQLVEMYLHRGTSEGARLWADALEIIKSQAEAALHGNTEAHKAAAGLGDARELVAIALRELAKRENPGSGGWNSMGAISKIHWLGEADKILALLHRPTSKGDA